MSEYCLRWNNHRPNLVTVFSELLTSEALVDVTLATDGHYIRAHKLVLSACSIYFKDLFASSPCKHPIVILKDISIEALKTVIDFIYRGEVTVSQDKLQEVLRTAESLRIKGLTDNPRSYDELPSHGLRNASSSFSSQVSLATRQRSSLTDSRDQSLSLEGEDEGEPGTPPSSKKRKIASEHDSLESSQDNVETEENNRLGDVKHEPSEDRDNERSLSRETESEYNLGASSENAEEAGGAAGPSDSATPQHAQGRAGKRGLLQRQQGIIKDAAVEERRGDDNQNGGGTQQLQVAESRVSVDISSSTHNFVTSANAATSNSTTLRIAGAIGKADSQPEVIIPDTVVVTGSVPQPTLLQVPAVMVGGPRETLTPTPPPLSKTHSTPTPLLAPAPLSKQASQPEFRGPPTHQGPPALSKQRSHPGVLNYTPAHSIERVPSNSSSTTQQQQQHHLQQQHHQQQHQQSLASQQHLQVIPMQAVFVKQRSSPGSLPSISAQQQQQLRPIQPKPSDGTADIIKIKDLPTIRVMPSEDVGPGGGGGAPPPMQRAVSEEPSRHSYSTTSTSDQLLPGPSVLVQSVSQDSGLGSRADQYRIASPQLNPSIHNPPIRSPSITPLHCPALRNGPALGCNFCWNSTDTQGRVLRRKTKYHCPECRTNLCIVPCFHEYHKQMERAQDTQKQISKILTKTGSI